MYILEESSGHIFSDSHFGFVSGRETEIATALVNDVISHANVGCGVDQAHYIHVRLMQRVNLMRYHIVCYSRRHLKYFLIILGA